MKVYAYRVVQRGPRSLEQMLAELNLRPLEQRVFDASSVGLRLEHTTSDGAFVFADFAAARVGHGPGKMSANGPLTEIELEDGEAFGEDTGFVYHPPSGYLALQYNHAGPRVARVAQYLIAADLSLGGVRQALPGEATIDRAGFSFGAVLKPDAYSRLARFGIIKELEFEVSVPGARASDRAMGRSLSDILDAPLPSGIDTIKISMRASREAGGQLGRSGAMQIIDDLHGLGAMVQGGYVKGKQDEGTRLEAVDLVQERLSSEALVTTGRGRRYTRTDRWGAMERILDGWLTTGALPVAP
ncbi:DUF6731 family protein [Devosia epidermidihirudinis]|nr:DUF6731 family protein [Devosia epidermidihirudinis]